MKRKLLAVMTWALVPCLGQAQSSDFSKGHGYVYFAPGGLVTLSNGSEGTMHIGGGGEGFFTRHLGAGGNDLYRSKRPKLTGPPNPGSGGKGCLSEGTIRTAEVGGDV